MLQTQPVKKTHREQNLAWMLPQKECIKLRCDNALQFSRSPHIHLVVIWPNGSGFFEETVLGGNDTNGNILRPPFLPFCLCDELIKGSSIEFNGRHRVGDMVLTR